MSWNNLLTGRNAERENEQANYSQKCELYEARKPVAEILELQGNKESDQALKHVNQRECA